MKKIVGLVATETGVTVYASDGESINLSRDEYDLKPLTQVVMDGVSTGAFATIDLANFRSGGRKVEAAFSGLGRFKMFRVLKESVASLFASADPEAKAAEVAMPMSRVDKEKETTIVSVSGSDVLPGTERLKVHLDHAKKNNLGPGLELFMSRMAKVARQRGHTAQELLAFIEKGNLPITEDGSVLGYKSLYASDGGWYVDPHTKKVRQRLGSFVQMDEKLVDRNRATECSVGLHVGRQDYVASFSGNNLFIVKIAPEDVIAVPLYEASKMRVCGYHIVAHLTPEQRSLVIRHESISKAESGQKLIADIVRGNHVAISEIVTVGGSYGSDVTTKAPETVEEPKKVKKLVKPMKALDDMPVEKPSKNSVIDLVGSFDAKAAAASGDLSAALILTPEKKVEKPAPKAKAKSKTVGKRVLTDEQKAALQIVKNGKSVRSAERSTGVSARTISRLIKEGF
jgi:hypothetical protein